jgi:hypothetical protein
LIISQLADFFDGTGFSLMSRASFSYGLIDHIGNAQ